MDVLKSTPTQEEQSIEHEIDDLIIQSAFGNGGCFLTIAIQIILFEFGTIYFSYVGFCTRARFRFGWIHSHYQYCAPFGAVMGSHLVFTTSECHNCASGEPVSSSCFFHNIIVFILIRCNGLQLYQGPTLDTSSEPVFVYDYYVFSSILMSSETDGNISPY